jgi:tetratricopeptide (TPR) repeat protein
MGDERSLAMVLTSLGGVLQHLGRIEEADRAFVSSLNLGEKLRDKMHLAKVRTAYGKALVSRGDLDRGIEHLREGFLSDERARNKRGLAIVTPLLVNALAGRGKDQEGRDYLRRALAIAPNEAALQRLEVTGGGTRPDAAIRLTGRIKRLLEPMGRSRYGFLTPTTGTTSISPKDGSGPPSLQDSRSA